jgi:hypothetical protein
LTDRPPLALRVFAILAAVALVGAFALAICFPPDMSLRRVLLRADGSLFGGLEEWVQSHWGEWAWRRVVLPMLVRPAWLTPLALGVVMAGLALTFGSGGRAARSQRRGN